MKNIKIIHYQTHNNAAILDINISIEEQKAWLTINDLALLFNKDRSVLVRQIKKLEKEGGSPCTVHAQFMHRSATNRRAYYYDFDLAKLLVRTIYPECETSVSDLEGFLNSYLKQNGPINDKIIIYDNGYVELDVRISPYEETVWLNTNQIALLFGTSRPNISIHINNIFEDKELDISVSKKYLHTAQDDKQYEVDFFNLDMILAIGYRVKSEQAIKFRKWATKVLSQLLMYGEVKDDKRCLICQNEILQLKNNVNELMNNQRKEIMYFNGEFLRGFIEIKRFLETAKEEIIIIDNYFDNSFDDVLKEINVHKIVITNNKNEKIHESSFYELYKSNAFHARYIIVDDICYHSDPSFKDIGNHDDLVMRINEPSFIDHIKNVVQQIIQGGK